MFVFFVVFVVFVVGIVGCADGSDVSQLSRTDQHIDFEGRKTSLSSVIKLLQHFQTPHVAKNAASKPFNLAALATMRKTE